ncbi:MAG: bifunctional 2-C-methyl-D-erythritol 4-phosphate cytidylyltransferase/2-C-methyl-D-erythritol 2,4-cyclodiphosphate synthase [Reyranella sp.]|uniref:bifunctional 2-C-methyl-D-erythritol 4-phosphate cytidylyltransferase/2-C-methyl-D-erythritol 2,4-cyclodiphosphate synthase n=1 Tax=Reyranella sp. TaxID=1929291 RepID=UPI0012273CC3|nr:bifunctional 2-C-methyl-D-erythritol 4-phosphate cytidylyltransferase/2-C-methyl-D-erythritol 2,4-cyclodiphosphate synthase [Reyranella sp.]TAJ40717.1 MAG: bifunctional 2-C-methyl-D-erythritol 4-phosphate cytidylyltransferase/2-C-methyl-D-erythritol 2,4-cyclodiphosphate synthase [Reyranella sp.]
MPTCTALIVAAGRGSRFGGPLPKQYALLGTQPVLWHTLTALRGAPGISQIQVVIAPGDELLYQASAAGFDLPPPVAGGASRQLSVLNGLEALAGAPPDFVAIHDAARPFVRPTDIAACLDAAAVPGIDGAVLGVALADTLKRVKNDGVISETVPRRHLWRAQTPQVFRFARLLEAHRASAPLGATEATALTDDAAVAERAGLKVVMVAGSGDNAKITTIEDLQRAATMETRTAFGFDVHGFAPGSAVVLGGIAIPHGQALSGHSDADVALHALTDAVLGTIGAGDIGKHFPPSDPQWRGASSDRFMRHAVGLLAERGGRIVHLDLTLICEAPRIGPHREAMVDSIARIAGVGRDRVSVKATTTEGLGFTGRREGIAAQAVATVEVPRS